MILFLLKAWIINQYGILRHQGLVEANMNYPMKWTEVYSGIPLLLNKFWRKNQKTENRLVFDS